MYMWIGADIAEPVRFGAAARPDTEGPVDLLVLERSIIAGASPAAGMRQEQDEFPDDPAFAGVVQMFVDALDGLHSHPKRIWDHANLTIWQAE
jgi:hypothetical protein